jgi:hypothetical protein
MATSGFLFHLLGEVFVLQRGRKIRQNLCRLVRHFRLPLDA